MGVHHRRVDGLQLGSGPFQRRARREPPEELGHAVPAFFLHRRPEVVRARHDVRDDLCLGRVGHRGLEDADDRRVAGTQTNDLADDGRIGVEHRRPEPVSQDRDRRRLGPVVAGIDQPPERRPEPHDVEERSVDHARRHDARLPAEPDQREVDGGEIAERGDRLHARLEVADLRHREGEVLRPDAPGGLADVEQPIRIPIDERTQEHAPNDAEDRRIGADAERERHDHGDGQSPGAQKRTQADSYFLEEQQHGVGPAAVPDPMHRVANGRHGPEFLERGLPGGLWILATLDPFPNAQLQVAADFVLEVAVVGSHGYSATPRGPVRGS